MEFLFIIIKAVAVSRSEVKIKMEFIPKDRILETKPDTLEFIRKQYNLDKPGCMKEAVNILRDWVQNQNHFKRKDFNEHYYETSIIICRGCLERAKKQLDKMCTLRSLLPNFFGNYNAKTDFGHIYEFCYVFTLPKLTDQHLRIMVLRFNKVIDNPSHSMDIYKYIVILAEYLRNHDYTNGFKVILDCSNVHVMEAISRLNLYELRQARTIMAEGYGIKIQAIHLISPSKLIDAIVLLMKQVLSAKVGERIHVHNNIEEIYKHIPKSILPKDYGGEERSLKELQTEWIEALSSEEHMKYLRDMNEAATDETLRQKYTFTDQYAGMPGTFRLLSVD